MPIRRATDPLSVQDVWDVIQHATSLKQIVDLARIVNDLTKVKEYSYSNAERALIQTVQDKLVVTKNEKSETFKMPSDEQPNLDGHDWYCFECHLAGDVVCCESCFRVFHAACTEKANDTFETYKATLGSFTPAANAPNSSMSTDLGVPEEQDANTFNKSLCLVCNVASLRHEIFDKAEINYLMKFILSRIKSWLPKNITHKMAEDATKPILITDTELTWRANQLFYEHRDMTLIEINLNAEYYNQLYEFLGDVLTVQHNVAIFHGVDSQEYGAAEFMVRDTIHDIAEINNCYDCYKHSNEKVNVKWFALPCQKSHTLVWAKQKGYPYWPAKVIKEMGRQVDVRFFGSRHERAVLSQTLIKPITVSKQSLQLKMSPTLKKAIEEMELYQRFEKDPSSLKEFVDVASQKKTSRKSTTSTSRTSTANNSLDSSRNSIDFNVPGVSVSRKRSSSNSGSQKGGPKKKMNTSASTLTKADEKGEIRDGVINISDLDDEDDEDFSDNFRDNEGGECEQLEQVTSSTEHFRNAEPSTSQMSDIQQLDSVNDEVEKMKTKLEKLTDKSEIIKAAVESMKSVIENHNDHLKLLFEANNAQISETKKKQWCYNCEQDAIYHCCWNTAYCSTLCQQQHWQEEHKKVCRRKR